MTDRVLLFGRSLLSTSSNRYFGDEASSLVSQQCGLPVDVFPFPAGKPLPDLTPYRLVVLQYSPFSCSINDDSHEKQQIVFIRKMSKALTARATFG